MFGILYQRKVGYNFPKKMYFDIDRMGHAYLFNVPIYRTAVTYTVSNASIEWH